MEKGVSPINTLNHKYEPMNLACDITKERNNLSGRATPATHCSKA